MADNFPLRMVDLKVDSFFTAGRLNNKTGGVWEKFAAGGKDTVTGGTSFTIAKPGDTDITYTPESRELFDAGVQGSAYESALNDKKSAKDVMQPKRQSDMLSSMLQATIMRHSTRLRNACAVMSRRASIAKFDAELITMELNK